MQEQIADVTSIGELFEKYEKLAQSHNLMLVSNRGPLEYRSGPNGDFQARRGSGVVVTALNAILENIPFTWIANAMGEGDRKAAEATAGRAIPSPITNHKVSVRFVVTPRRTYHKFYNIFCNPLLWFLQHQMWSAPYTPNIDNAVHDAWTTGYAMVNQALAETLIEEANKSEKRPVIVLHDYHLYLVAGIARKQLPDALIYHYIHIPWPATRNWQQLPAEIRTSICESLASCDLVGFQSSTDVTNFLHSCETFIPGSRVDYASKIVDVGGHQTRVAAYPMSIDIQEIRNIGDSTRTREHETNIQSLSSEFTLVRVDRAEPNKNIIRGFRSYSMLLQQHPELLGKVTFLAFLAPSRTHIKQYERYLEEIESVIQEINKTYGSNGWQPIHVFYENNYSQAMAGLRLYDGLLVNPVIDGMNLVAKEGPVVNTKDGVVILSETSGSYESLEAGILSVAPADLSGTANKLHEAILMSKEERRLRSKTLINLIAGHDVNRWHLDQVSDISTLIDGGHQST